MKQFKHTIITYDHLLGLNVDGDLDKLIDDPELAGKNQNSLKAMLAIRNNLDFKVAAENHIILCHSHQFDGSISCRLAMPANDLLSCKFYRYPNSDTPWHNFEFPYGPVYIGKPTGCDYSRQVDDDEQDLVNSVEIARVYPDRIMCKPKFCVKRYSVEPDCVKYGYELYREVYYGNFRIDTTFAQKETDFAKLNSILVDGVNAYMSKQHNALIATVLQLRKKTVLRGLTPGNDGTLSTRWVSMCYEAFLKNKKTTFFGNTATRFRIGPKSIYVFRAFGVHHIHVQGVPGTVVTLDDHPCSTGTCKPALLDQMRRYADFVTFVDRIEYANNALRDFIFEAYVIHGIKVITETHVFDMPYTDTPEYLNVSSRTVRLERDKDKKYLWWLNWNGRKVKLGLAVGKGPHFFGSGWSFTEPAKDILEQVRRIG
ncbi:MAG: hypothetical protein IKA48_00695 [Fibrobacter sp.]|nr:hypothetical protein [Fibrobacter sp.]